jgi:hypothetical protein
MDISMFRVCIKEYCLMYPSVVLLYIPLLILLIYFMSKTFVSFFSKYEREEFSKAKKLMRVLMTISRAIILLCLLIAIASPVSFKEKTVKGDYTLTILADSSKSFDIFPLNTAENLRDSIKDQIPANIRYIASGNRSDIGDALLNNIQGNDNVLLISDGNTNYGKTIGDVMFLASYLNTTVSTLELKPEHTDYRVVIEAPQEVTLGNEFTYYVDVYQTGDKKGYHIKVKVDESIVLDEDAEGEKSYELSDYVREGYHNISAQLKIDDFFPENNIFYKTVRILPKPDVLYVTSSGNHKIEEILQRLYLPDMKFVIPYDLSPYSTVILDDVPVSEISKNFDRLSQYVSDGNGLVVIGGKQAFDNGGYENSLFETLLPVSVGVPSSSQEGDVNIAIVIDISGTTTLAAGSSGTTKISIQKAQAIELLKTLPLDYNVGVVAFDSFGYYLTKKMAPLGDQPTLNDTISRIISNPQAGTEIGAGLQSAFYLLDGLPGSNNVILISDGITNNPQRAIGNAQRMALLGMKIYTVGIGKDTNRAFMQSLALEGNGMYFEPTETQKLVLIFNGTEEQKMQKNSLIILNAHHFITENLPLKVSISGFNQVVPKPSARLLISSYSSNPILTVWRFGLGRVATITTNPEYWSDDMLAGENAQLITRTLNWAIGDPSRSKEFDIKVKDINLGETAEIGVVSKKPFSSEQFSFSKVGESYYTADYLPDSIGIKHLLGAQLAVNYNIEYQNIGLNPELHDLVALTGGKTFTMQQKDELVEFIKSKSQRKVMDSVYFRWPFLLIALVLFMLEVMFRRIQENRNIFKSRLP